MNLRLPSTAAAARPNRIIIGGAGTCVPLLVPPVEPVDEELLLEDEDELLDDELELVELVILPVLPLVDMPEVLMPLVPPDDPELLDEDELLELLEEEPLEPPVVFPLVV